jgi:hypothetical protein
MLLISTYIHSIESGNICIKAMVSALKTVDCFGTIEYVIIAQMFW